MSESVRKHFNKLLKEHTAKKQSKRNAHGNNIGKRSRREITVGTIHDISGLFDGCGSDSESPHSSTQIPVSSRLSRGSTIRSSSRIRDEVIDLEEECPSPPKRRRTGAAKQNLTISIGTQTLDNSFTEEELQDESSSHVDDQLDVTYRDMGTQMESGSLFKKTFSRTVAQPSSIPSSSSRTQYDIDMSKDDRTATQSHRSNRKLSQSRRSYTGMLNRSTSDYYSADISRYAYGQPPTEKGERKSLIAQLSHSMRSKSKVSRNSMHAKQTSHISDTPKSAAGDSERRKRKTPVNGSTILDKYTEMMSSQKAVPAAKATGNSPTRRNSSLRKRLSFKADVSRGSTFSHSRETVVQRNQTHNDVAAELLDEINNFRDGSGQNWRLESDSEKEDYRRLSSRSNSVRTLPKKSLNSTSRNAKILVDANQPSSANRNPAKRELSFSEKSRNSNRKNATKLSLSSNPRKSLKYTTQVNKSSHRQSTQPTKSLTKQRSGYTKKKAYDFALVNYSMSDKDSSHDETGNHVLVNSHKSQNRSTRSKRQSSRCNHTYYNSMREADIASELESVVLKSHSALKRDRYSVTSSDGDNNIQLTSRRKKKTPNQNRSKIVRTSVGYLPHDIPSSSAGPSSKIHEQSPLRASGRRSKMRIADSDSHSDLDEHPTIVENSDYRKFRSPANNRQDTASTKSKRYSNVREWLRTEGQEETPRHKVVLSNKPNSQFIKRRSKCSPQHPSVVKHLSLPFPNESTICHGQPADYDSFPDVNYGPPSSTPRVLKARKVIPQNAVVPNEEGEGDDLAETAMEEESAISNDSYTVRPKSTPRRSKSKTVSATKKKEKPSYKVTPKYRKSFSDRKTSQDSSNVDNSQKDQLLSENDATLTAEQLPIDFNGDMHSSPAREKSDIATSDVASTSRKPATRNKKKKTEPKQKATKNSTKAKSRTQRKSNKKTTSKPSDDTLTEGEDRNDYVVLPIAADVSESSGLRRSKRLKTKVSGIGEGFQYSDTLDENGFRKVVGIRKIKTVLSEDVTTNAYMICGSKIKPKPVKKSSQKRKKSKNNAGTSKDNEDIPLPNVSVHNDRSSRDIRTLPSIVEETDVRAPSEVSTEASEHRTFSIAERTVNIVNSTTNSYNTLDLLSVFSNDEGLLGAKPVLHTVHSGVKITRGINLCESGISSSVQGQIILEPRTHKSARIASTGTMCFFIHQGQVEATVSGETVTLPCRSYFQVPHKNRYALFNPDEESDAILFYCLNLDQSSLE